MSAPGQRGFTLVEVLLAMFVSMVGLVGFMAIVPTASYAIQEGKQLSTATMLANEKLEQSRIVPWTTSPANDCLGLSALATSAPTVPAGAACTLGSTTVGALGGLPWFADQGTTAISGFGGYSRTVRVTDCGVAPGCAGITDAAMRLVTVTVLYTPMKAVGVSSTAKTVTVSLVVSQR